MTIKPFCVKSEDLTDEELNLMLEKCVNRGATPFLWVEGFSESHQPGLYKRLSSEYWGVAGNGDTYTSYDPSIYHDNILTKDEAFEMLSKIESKENKQPTLESIAKWFEVVYPETNPTTHRVQLGVHFEEVTEMQEAIGLGDTNSHKYLSGTAEFLKKSPDSLESLAIDKPALLDALCDQIVTAIGVAHNFDLDIIGALAEVNRSNYSKFNNGVPIYDENGKLAKGDNYEPPKLGKFYFKTDIKTMKGFDKMAELLGEERAEKEIQAVIDAGEFPWHLDYYDRNVWEYFSWDMTPQGALFWIDVNKRARPDNS